MSRVVITGDSWGCGEWPHVMADSVSHPGVTKYLMDHGIEVKNLSKAGSGNRDALYRLQHHIEPTDIVIWIKTDPLRDLRPYNDFIQQVIDANGVFGLAHIMADQAYATANAIANEFGVQIYCVGGLCDLDLGLMLNYPRLTALVPSWVQTVTQAKLSRPFQGFSDWPVKKLLSANLEYDMADKVINELDQINQNETIFQHEIFNPDGRHPNRYGHEFLASYVIQNLQL